MLKNPFLPCQYRLYVDCGTLGWRTILRVKRSITKKL